MGERKPGDPVGIPYESRLRRSARLVGVAWRLVRRDRTMLTLAIAGAAFGALAAVVLAWAGGYLDGHPSRGRLMLAVLLTAWPLTFVSVFLNVGLAAAAILVILAALSATQGVFAVALYRYAADGAVTGGFPQAYLEAPFTKRRRRRFGRRDDA